MGLGRPHQPLALTENKLSLGWKEPSSRPMRTRGWERGTRLNWLGGMQQCHQPQPPSQPSCRRGAEPPVPPVPAVAVRTGPILANPARPCCSFLPGYFLTRFIMVLRRHQRASKATAGRHRGGGLVPAWSGHAGWAGSLVPAESCSSGVVCSW